MASTTESQSIPLKNKLSQVKYLLEDANKRLEEERTKCEIFTTKTSASSNSPNLAHDDSEKGFGLLPTDLVKTITDISTLRSVLSCPIFNRIVNVTDSLDKLSYQLNLHPSISPADISIDANGELILAPPIEPTSLNNLINSKLDEYSENNDGSPQLVGSDLVHKHTKGIATINNQQQDQQVPSNRANQQESTGRFIAEHAVIQQQHQFEPLRQVQPQNFNAPPNIIRQKPHPYGVEKLVSSGVTSTFLGNDINGKHLIQRDLAANPNVVSAVEDSQLYKPDGQFSLNKVEQLSGQPMAQAQVSNDQLFTKNIGVGSNGYSNEVYNIAQELNLSESMATTNQALQSKPVSDQLNVQNHDSPYMNNIRQPEVITTSNSATPTTPSTARTQNMHNYGVQYNRSSCSPSTSAGSTIRLADECDSGASSYQSHVIKTNNGASYSLYSNQKCSNQNSTIIHDELRVESVEQELIDNLSSEMERIQVTLEKDSGNSLGITIAGYTFQNSEIAGIFIRSITPDGPADRSGKIRTLDQIFSVNGRELLGFSNPEAVHVLRNTGKVVTLELVRYLSESKYQILQTALSHAVPALNSKLSSYTENRGDAQCTSSPKTSTFPLIPTREIAESNKYSFLPVASSQLANSNSCHQETESIYKNDFLAKNNGSKAQELIVPQNLQNSDSVLSQTPVAAQRGASKIIDIKQGARNTIEIRSSVGQSLVTATYANETLDMAQKKHQGNAPDVFERLGRGGEPNWEKDAQIIELYKDITRGLGFTVKEYANPKDQKESIIMITSLAPGGIADRDGRLSIGDLLIFVDDTNLEGAGLAETVKALKKTNGQVRLGVLKLKRV